MLKCRLVDGRILPAEVVMVRFDQVEGVEFFAHHPFDERGRIVADKWVVSEFLTGRMVSRYKDAMPTIDGACEAVRRRVRSGRAGIRLSLKRALRVDGGPLNSPAAA